FLAYQREARSIEHVAAYTRTAVNLAGPQEPERVNAASVTRNIFETLRVMPEIGRGFRDDDVATDVMIIGYDLWRRRFGGARSILGRRAQANGRARMVVGVMPPTFRLPLDLREEKPSEVFFPLDLTGPVVNNWGDHSLFGIVRLRNGVTRARATAELTETERGWIRAGFRRDQTLSGRQAMPVRDLVLGDFQRGLFLLIDAALVILLITCANVANLLLARGDDRRREIAVRTALGAARGRIIRQLLTESVILAALGALVGTALAFGGVRLLVALRPAEAPLIGAARVDINVFAFALALAVATGVLFGLAPALELSRQDTSRTLRESRSLTPDRT